MSLTILPTMWARMLRIDDPYVFKIFFQAFFALSAAALYLVCRRHFSRTSAFLAAIFYISFPTFLTDMPFITRQETGFTFLSVAALVLMSDSWASAARRFWFVIFGIAIVLSHYSTTYLLLIALVFSQVLWRGWQLCACIRARRWPRRWATRRGVGPVAGHGHLRDHRRRRLPVDRTGHPHLVSAAPDGHRHGGDAARSPARGDLDRYLLQPVPLGRSESAPGTGPVPGRDVEGHGRRCVQLPAPGYGRLVFPARWPLSATCR